MSNDFKQHGGKHLSIEDIKFIIHTLKKHFYQILAIHVGSIYFICLNFTKAHVNALILNKIHVFTISKSTLV